GGQHDLGQVLHFIRCFFEGRNHDNANSSAENQIEKIYLASPHHVDVAISVGEAGQGTSKVSLSKTKLPCYFLRLLVCWASISVFWMLRISWQRGQVGSERFS